MPTLIKTSSGFLDFHSLGVVRCFIILLFLLVRPIWHWHLFNSEIQISFSSHSFRWCRIWRCCCCSCCRWCSFSSSSLCRSLFAFSRKLFLTLVTLFILGIVSLPFPGAHYFRMDFFPSVVTRCFVALLILRFHFRYRFHPYFCCFDHSFSHLWSVYFAIFVSLQWSPQYYFPVSWKSPPYREGFHVRSHHLGAQLFVGMFSIFFKIFVAHLILRWNFCCAALIFNLVNNQSHCGRW